MTFTFMRGLVNIDLSEGSEAKKGGVRPCSEPNFAHETYQESPLFEKPEHKILIYPFHLKMITLFCILLLYGSKIIARIISQPYRHAVISTLAPA